MRACPPTPAAWTRHDFEAVERTTEGMDLAGMMGLTRVLRETDLALVPIRPRRARVVEPAGGHETDEEGRLVTEIDDPSLPRAVIFRDSFVSRLVPFLSEHFSRAVYLWQNDFDAAEVEKEHPDVVIQEIVGRHLYNFIPSPELVPPNDPTVFERRARGGRKEDLIFSASLASSAFDLSYHRTVGYLIPSCSR